MQETDFKERAERIRAAIMSLPITFQARDAGRPATLTEEKLGRIYERVHAGKMKVPELMELIRKYPEFPPLKNYLMNTHLSAGNDRAAIKVAEEMVKAHPDYLFGKLSYGVGLLKHGRVEELSELLGEDLDLRKMAPEAKDFHASEVVSFCQVLNGYLLEEGDLQGMAAVIDALESRLPGHEAAEQLAGQLMQARIEKHQEKLADDMKRRIAVEGPEFPEEGGEAPGLAELNHPEVEILREVGYEIPLGKLEAILALPRESVVADLKGLLAEGKAWAGELFGDDDFNNENGSFPIHALWLLGELDPAGAIPDVLEFLDQNTELIEFWLVDHSPEEILYPFVNVDAGAFVKWLNEPGHAGLAKGNVIDAMTVMARQSPERRDEVVGYFSNLLGLMLRSPRDGGLLDTEVVGMLIWQLSVLDAREQIDLIREAYEMGLVMKSVVGPIDDLFDTGPAKPQRIPPLLERYRMQARKLAGAREAARPPSLPVEEVVTGRNDPCPCGSGKKFKKCCM